jgi:hypothetical protein
MASKISGETGWSCGEKAGAPGREMAWYPWVRRQDAIGRINILLGSWRMEQKLPGADQEKRRVL